MNNVPEFPPSSLINAFESRWKAARNGILFVANPNRVGSYDCQELIPTLLISALCEIHANA